MLTMHDRRYFVTVRVMPVGTVQSARDNDAATVTSGDARGVPGPGCPMPAESGVQGAAHDGDAATEQIDAVAVEAHADGAAARRRLVADEFVLAELRSPVWPERAVGRSGDRILPGARRGGEKAGDEVVTVGVGHGGDDRA